MLIRRGLVVEAKPFSAGLRIEHLQSDIDSALYGPLAGDLRLPVGEYALSCRIAGTGVYTFCMCPGGLVVAASSEEGGIVTNGMSRYARDGRNANSALVTSVSFASPQEGMEFQRILEQRAYEMTGGYRVPAQDLRSFRAGREGLSQHRVQPSYSLGAQPARLDRLLGQPIANRLADATGVLGGKLRGFDDDGALLSGPETRTSSPLRLRRDSKTRFAEGVTGLYPCGEGAGYAGGIMSAAVDGLRSAIALTEWYRQPDGAGQEE